MKLKFIKDTPAIYGHVYKKDEVIVYNPWNYSWQGKDEPTRVSQGLFVFCHGHGEFCIFKQNIDVEITND